MASLASSTAKSGSNSLEQTGFGGGANTYKERDERKRQRAERIEKRFVNEVNETGRTKGDGRSNEVIAKSKGHQQVADSLANLDKKKSTGIEEVTAIRIEADHRENQRRIKDDGRAQERLQMLQEEAISSGKLNAAIEMRWAELLELNMPQQLYHEIEAQKKACAEIILSKEDLTREFKKQLKVKDEEYVKALKRYGEDVEELLRRMRKEIKSLQQTYDAEMDSIEDAFLKEREEIISSHKGEIEDLFDKRRQKELAYMKAKQDREEEYQKEIEELLVQDGEEYNKLKIKLESEIQTKEQQLEEMRATYQLNTEKLEYNYRVLTERDMENTATLAHQKKKLAKLKDLVHNSSVKFYNNDIRDKKRNEELTEEYRRITKQYKDLQAKFRHFEVADNERFEKVWAMHEEEVCQAVDKVLAADQILHQQLFGWNWKPPKLDLIYNPDQLASSSGAAGHEDGAAAEGSHHQQELAPGEEEGEEEEHAKQEAGLVIDVGKVKSMLELIASEAGFLVEPKVKEALSSMQAEAAQMAQAESLLRSLGITNESDLNALLMYFHRDIVVDAPSAMVVEEEERNEKQPQISSMLEPLKHLQTVIQPDDVIEAIQQFIEDRKEGLLGSRQASLNAPVTSRTGRLSTRQGGGGGNGMTARSQAAGGGAVSSVGGNSLRCSGNKNKKKPGSLTCQEKEFWTRMGSVLPDQHLTAWKQVEKEMVAYNKLLKERGRTLETICQLQQDNASMKQLLNAYLADRVNEELIIPPTETFKLVDGGADGRGSKQASTTVKAAAH